MELNFNKNFYILRNLAFTDDGVLIYNVIAYNVPRFMRHEDLAAYFEKWGNVLRVSIYTHRMPARRRKAPKMAFINFENPIVAARVLQKGRHLICNKRVYVKACDSWRQPRAGNFTLDTGTITDEQFAKMVADIQNVAFNTKSCDCSTQTPPPQNSLVDQQLLQQQSIVDRNVTTLNDDCLVLICRKLRLKDQISFALTCQRFRSIAEMCFRIQYRELQVDVFYDCTLYEIYGFLELAGPYIEKIVGCMPLHNRDRIAEFVRKYCYSLRCMSLVESKMRATSLTLLLDRMLQITELGLADCGLLDEAVRNIAKLQKLVTLKLDNNSLITGKYLALNRQVRHLSLAGCSSLKNINMIAVAVELKQLTSLDLRRVPQLYTLPQYLRRHSHNLRSIKLTVVENYDWTNLANIEQLRYLSIDFPNPDLPANSQFFELISKRNQLETLDITSRRSLTPASISYISQLEHLHTFICMRNLNVNDQCLMQLSELKNLVNVNISGCTNFKKTGFIDLIRNCVKLKLLNVQYCTQIVANYIFEAIKVLTKQRTRLTTEPLKLMVFRTSLKNSIENDYHLRNAREFLHVTFETFYRMQLCRQHFAMFYYNNEEFEDWTDEEEDAMNELTRALALRDYEAMSSDSESDYDAHYFIENESYYDSSD